MILVGETFVSPVFSSASLLLPSSSHLRNPASAISIPLFTKKTIKCSVTLDAKNATRSTRDYESLDAGRSRWNKDKGRRKSNDKWKQDKEDEAASILPPARTTPRKTHSLLRIIRGKAYGKKLLSPIGMDVRPMMELVRRASFDILQAASGSTSSFPPGRWLDLYSGTGSVGLEAMSRGCSEVHFVEMDPWVVEKVLTPNIDHTGFSEQSVVHMVRVEAFLKQCENANNQFGSFDYVSVTPPYQVVDYPTLMDQLSRSPAVGKDTFILVEHPSGVIMDEYCGSLLKIVDRRYGRTNLAVYAPEWARRKRSSKASNLDGVGKNCLLHYFSL